LPSLAVSTGGAWRGGWLVLVGMEREDSDGVGGNLGCEWGQVTVPWRTAAVPGCAVQLIAPIIGSTYFSRAVGMVRELHRSAVGAIWGCSRSSAQPAGPHRR